MEDEALDAEWEALANAIHARDDLSRAVEVLARRHHLDQAGATRRLVWLAVDGQVDLVAAARRVLDDEATRLR